MTYDEIIYFLHKKYKITEVDCERIVDSQFRLVANTIQAKEIKVINLIGLGKFTPVARRLRERKELEQNNDNNRFDIPKEQVDSDDTYPTRDIQLPVQSQSEERRD